MGRRKRLNVPRSAGSSPVTSNQGSKSYSSRKIHSRCNSLDFMSGSAKDSRSDDEFSTPIPSLHGNLVRSRYRRDPLEFYEPLEPIGEGSMGSVSKVRKRSEVIGGSARPKFVKTHSNSNKLFGWLPIPDFCLLRKSNQSDVWSNSSNKTSGGSMKDSGGRFTNGEKNSPSTLPKTRNSAQNCFFMFCCPAQEKQNILEAIDECSEGRDKHVRGGSSFLQGCFGGIIIKFCQYGTSKEALSSINLNGGDSTGLKKQHSEQSNASSEGANGKSSTILDQTDYEEIERELEGALKRSTSSMITYGHKDVVYALKSIHLDRVSCSEFMKELKNEVSILKQLDHPNIVKCYETFMYKGALYLVLELCSGSDLYSRDPYSEEQACKIIRAMFSAVAYMHSKQITHRDLKYENIMFASTNTDAEVKIIDFGLSKKYAADSFLHETVGTVYTMAPELLKGGYNEKVDVWSLGVISFMLLSSSMPFYGKDRMLTNVSNRKQVIKKIVKGQYEFISRRWKRVSPGAKNFVTKMLQHNPNKRPTASKSLDDPWLNRFDDNASQETNFGGDEASLDKVQASIQTFAGYGKLKKLALMLIAYKSTSAEIGFLRQMFDKFDTLHDGELTMEEFKAALEDYDYSDEELQHMFRAMDLDGAGMVHYSEFLAATFETHGGISEEQLAECFDRLDNDDSGYITKEDILDFLGEDIPQSYIEDIMEEADTNNDNKISYDEFLALWDTETDAMMRKDRENVKERRHRRAHSSMSGCASSTCSFEFDISDDSDDFFDDLVAVAPTSFESNEIAKMLDGPDTPTNERRVSATVAFNLEKDRSARDASTRDQSRRENALRRDERMD